MSRLARMKSFPAGQDKRSSQPFFQKVHPPHPSPRCSVKLGLIGMCGEHLERMIRDSQTPGDNARFCPGDQSRSVLLQRGSCSSAWGPAGRNESYGICGGRIGLWIFKSNTLMIKHRRAKNLRWKSLFQLLQTVTQTNWVHHHGGSIEICLAWWEGL